MALHGGAQRLGAASRWAAGPKHGLLTWSTECASAHTSAAPSLRGHNGCAAEELAITRGGRLAHACAHARQRCALTPRT